MKVGFNSVAIFNRLPQCLARAGFVAVVSIVMSACVAGKGRDLSNHAPFNAYSGRTLALLRPVYVFDNHGESISLPRYSIDDGPINTVPPDFGFCRLPAGHVVHLDRVILDVGFDSGCLPMAIGRTFVPALGKEVRFYYYWGFQRSLSRAPWEPSNVPSHRESTNPGNCPW